MMTPRRRVEVASLAPSGEVKFSSRLLPAITAFEEPFAAFTRATLVATERGLTAVGDLLPGDRVETVDNGFQTLLWKGSTTLMPRADGQGPVMGKLTRIAADMLGIARPMHDLVLGPMARITHRAPAIARLTGGTMALIPARDFIDGLTVLDITPPAPVETCHLGFAGHEIIVANGVEVESYHPGPVHNLGLGPEFLDLFMSCFPHLTGSDDWGLPAYPRLRRADIDHTHAA